MKIAYKSLSSLTKNKKISHNEKQSIWFIQSPISKYVLLINNCIMWTKIIPYNSIVFDMRDKNIEIICKKPFQRTRLHNLFSWIYIRCWPITYTNVPLSSPPFQRRPHTQNISRTTGCRWRLKVFQSLFRSAKLYTVGCNMRLIFLETFKEKLCLKEN